MHDQPSRIVNFSSPAGVQPADEACQVSDDVLIDDALAGNAAAFGELVLRYQDRLCSSLSHMFGANSDVEDVVQEAFVLAFIKLSSFQRKSNFYTWLYRIARNRWISQHRRHHKTASLDRVEPQQNAEPTVGGDVPRIDQVDEIGMLQAALRELAEESREILVLRELEQLSYEQIASATALPLGTVRSRLHRARQQLLEIMKQKYPEGFTL